MFPNIKKPEVKKTTEKKVEQKGNPKNLSDDITSCLKQALSDSRFDYLSKKFADKFPAEAGNLKKSLIAVVEKALS